MFNVETELFILKNEIVARNTKSSSLENHYQYYKERKDGWIFSVVCNRLTAGNEIGLFEIAMWQRVGNDEIIVIDTHRSFDAVAKYEKAFDKNPAKLYMKYSV